MDLCAFQASALNNRWIEYSQHDLLVVRDKLIYHVSLVFKAALVTICSVAASARARITGNAPATSQHAASDPAGRLGTLGRDKGAEAGKP
jgi:hypothetical protein